MRIGVLNSYWKMMTRISKKYKSSKLERVKLHEVAEVFRGKSILKKDVKPGDIKVLNISNITDTGIDYSDMDSIEEEEQKSNAMN